jgi:hypothetical protein
LFERTTRRWRWQRRKPEIMLMRPAIRQAMDCGSGQMIITCEWKSTTGDDLQLMWNMVSGTKRTRTHPTGKHHRTTDDPSSLWPRWPPRHRQSYTSWLAFYHTDAMQQTLQSYFTNVTRTINHTHGISLCQRCRASRVSERSTTKQQSNRGAEDCGPKIDRRRRQKTVLDRPARNQSL